MFVDLNGRKSINKSIVFSIMLYKHCEYLLKMYVIVKTINNLLKNIQKGIRGSTKINIFIKDGFLFLKNKNWNYLKK